MGFFSANCKHCTHPILSPQATEDQNRWMSSAVAITEDGSILHGTYDGYGRLEGQSNSYEYAVGMNTAVWHHLCWEVAGKPTEFDGESEGSADQGWFFEDGVHNWPDPETARAHPNPDHHSVLG